MDFTSTCEGTKSWMFTLPIILEIQKLGDINLMLLFTFIVFLSCWLINWAYSSCGPAWKNGRNRMGQVPIPGPVGLPIFGSLLKLSHGLAHRTLAHMASTYGARELMAFSLGTTPVVVTSDTCVAREILSSPHFASRPIKESAKQLMFSRAIGFAPNGAHWRMLRRIASTHLFAPKRMLAHESVRQLECAAMLSAIAKEQSLKGFVQLRKHLQATSLNIIMEIVFGKRYDTSKYDNEAKELNELVREGFELLGAFNWSDHLSWLTYFYDPFHIQDRYRVLVPRVKKLVKKIIEEHRGGDFYKSCDTCDFVDVLLSLDGEEKLDEDDMIAILWEMIFRGTDTVALLTEWIIAELILNPQVQEKLYSELENLVKNKNNAHVVLTDADIAKSPYLDAVVKETLRIHPPGPLLSWARLSTADVCLKNGMVIPTNTTAMVNMWAITHDATIWSEPFTFRPERLLPTAGGVNIDVRGGDLRLAPFGAGRRVCPGKNLGLASVNLCVAKLVHHFKWVGHGDKPVDLSEELKLSCEMKNPLLAVAIPRL
ncbi:Cytochrome P450 CYP2 subfamily [Handroanthus impetiginosus]|uniref:Cytochrome P450 CYP2 subfamily n=1 Tax=Handroanthus impetiginosus TaxID=429701 RepID=A0A2G9G2W1_9LAMI|nr:Cytochrome P450 CYP2 subfamily [Handroanthus impetiginosus]